MLLPGDIRAFYHGDGVVVGQRVAQVIRVVMEGDMKNVNISLNWNGMIQTLVLVRLGQELGSDSRLAKAVHDLFDAMLTVLR
jgi:hypothetical protein